MSSLFPNLDAVSDSLEVTYDGPSFNGVMEINLLGESVSSLAFCLKAVLKKLKDNDRIELSESDIEILVEGLRSGSFKLPIRWIEKHQGTTTLLVGLGMIIVEIVGIIVNHNPTSIKNMSPELMTEIGDTIKVQLLSDQKFLDNLASTVSPLKCEEDKIVFKHSPEEQVVVPYEKRACFMELSSIEEADLPVVKVDEELKGRIVMIDIDATKNQVGFKVAGKGNEIRSSIAEGFTIDEFKPLLGEWVKINVTAEKKGDEYLFISINSYEKIDAPEEPKQQKIEF